MRWVKFAIVATLITLACTKPKDNATPSPLTPTPPPPNNGGGNSSPFLSTANVPIDGAEVLRCFTGMKMKDVRPRLLYSTSDIITIQQNAQADQVLKASYDDIISKAITVLSTPLLEYGLDGAGLRITSIHTFANEQLPFLVLAYQFTRDTRFALRCWQQLDRMCSYPDWGANRHFLDAGIAAKAIAMAYDGLFDYLSVQQRERLSSSVRNLVLQPGKTQIETNTGVWKWYLSNDNWNGICLGGMIMASLATYETDSAFHSSLIALCANNMLRYMQSFDPDGASEEGMSYWAYGLSNTFLALESMKRCLSTTYGLTEQTGFKKTALFPYLVSGPAGTATFGDDYLYVGKNNKFLSYCWFSHFWKDANMAKTHYDACLSINSNKTIKLNGWTDLLFYKKLLVDQGNAASFPLASYIRGIDYMYLQENIGNDNALYVGMHGGDNNASHGHLDAGTFFIQANGENFAVGSLGLEIPYPSDYFSAAAPVYSAPMGNAVTTVGRYSYYKIRTEGKSCLVFNPDARPEQNPVGKAILDRSANDNAGGYYTLDLTSNYNRDVTSYKRGIKLNRSTGIITIQDEFVPVKNSTVYWIMHSPSTDGLMISSDGKMATMTKNGKTYFARLVSPQNAVFELVNRSETAINYLTETQPIFSSLMNGKNKPNKWYGKLQIKMSDLSSATTIRIDFIKSNSQMSPSLIPMSLWTTGN